MSHICGTLPGRVAESVGGPKVLLRCWFPVEILHTSPPVENRGPIPESLHLVRSRDRVYFRTRYPTAHEVETRPISTGSGVDAMNRPNQHLSRFAFGSFLKKWHVC